jgi:hypothetical protein
MRLSLRRAVFVLCSLVVVALLAGSLSGCENQHIGRPCDLQVGDTGTATNGTAQATITGQVLQCPSRICILPAAEVKTDTGPYCTAECTSNDDCSDGEKRNMSNPDDKRCKTGYACGIASEVGAFCCKKMCICLDFVDAPGGQLPDHPACLPGMSTCHNVSPH